MGAPRRLLVIGLDGADHAIVSQWMADGHLPNISRLSQRGRLIPCASTHPPLTAPAWTTVMTGCNPGKHGVYDFLDMSCPRRMGWWVHPHRCATIWQRLSQAGLTCGVFNVPMTYPAEEIEGVMISGMGGPAFDARCFQPLSLREPFMRAFPDYEPFPRMGPGMWPDKATLIRFAEMQTAGAEYLWNRFDSDVFMLVLNSMDWAGHGYAHNRAPGGVYLEVAQAVDRCVGRLVAQTDWPRIPVLLVSDHGMRGVRRQINLPLLFIQLGILSVRWSGGGPGSAAPRLMRAWNLAKRVLPAGMIARIRRLADRQREAVVNNAPAATPDWSRTLADPVGAFGCVRMNLVGNHPEGKIPRGNYEQVRRQVMDRLAEACDPATGKRLFSRVMARDAVYRGPLLDEAPDIIVIPAEEDMALGGPAVMEQLPLFLADSKVVRPLSPACGTHSQTGIFLASGDAVADQFTPPAATLQDFAPTVLHLLGVRVPRSMDGRPLFTDPLSWMDDTAYKTDSDPNGPGVSGADEEELLERLRGLGYV